MISEEVTEVDSDLEWTVSLGAGEYQLQLKDELHQWGLKFTAVTHF